MQMKRAQGVLGGKNIVGTKHSKLKPTQSEVRINIVERYVKQIKTGIPLKPIEVYKVKGKGVFIMEGHHRYVASKLMGKKIKITYLPHGGPVGRPDWLLVEFVINFS